MNDYNLEEHDSLQEGLIKINDDLDNNLSKQEDQKLAMFLQELESVKIKEYDQTYVSEIIDSVILTIVGEPEESYPKCFKNVYYKVGPVAYHKAYVKRC